MEERIDKIQKEIRFERIKAWVLLFAFSFLMSLGFEEIYSMKIDSFLILYSILISTPWIFWLSYLMKGILKPKKYPNKHGDNYSMYIFEFNISIRNELSKYTTRLEILIVLMIVTLTIYSPLIKIYTYGNW